MVSQKRGFSCTIVAVQELAQYLLAYLRDKRFLRPGDRLGVAVSGGADSVALLCLMLELRGELGIVLSAVHFNHLLRADESEADEKFVRDLATEHGLEFHSAQGDVAKRAADRSLSIEAAAREARYEFFWSLLDGRHLNKIATAHTLDDQAETVLLRLIRGTGTRGLGGIQPTLPGSMRGQESAGAILRPLLQVRRKEVEGYLTAIGQTWREDSSNTNLHHTRNRVRQKLMPLLEQEFNPEIAERLADFAEIARAEESWWEQELPKHLPLRWEALARQPLALRRRLVRHAAEELGLQLEFRQIEEILAVAAGGGGAPNACNLPEGWTFVRQGKDFRFVPSASPKESKIPGLDQLYLPVPGQVVAPGADPTMSTVFEARKILLATPPAGYNPEHLYAPQALPDQLLVRTWRPGDRFWPAHTKAAKKLKELFQTKRIAAESRAAWPVIVDVNREVGEELVWVRGFAAPAYLRPQPGDREAILIGERVVLQSTSLDES